MGWLVQCEQALEVRHSHDASRTETPPQKTEDWTQRPVPLYWKIDLPGMAKVLAQKGMIPSSFTTVDHPHATLLYVGGSEDDRRAAELSNLPVDQFQAMRDALKSLQGEEFEVKLVEIIIEENVICALIS